MTPKVRGRPPTNLDGEAGKQRRRKGGSTEEGERRKTKEEKRRKSGIRRTHDIAREWPDQRHHKCSWRFNCSAICTAHNEKAHTQT